MNPHEKRMLALLNGFFGTAFSLCQGVRGRFGLAGTEADCLLIQAWFAKLGVEVDVADWSHDPAWAELAHQHVLTLTVPNLALAYRSAAGQVN